MIYAILLSQNGFIIELVNIKSNFFRKKNIINFYGRF